MTVDPDEQIRVWRRSAPPGPLTEYAVRKQRVYRELARMQADMDAAEPGTFGWEARNRLLEKVEQLPKREQAHWKANYLDQLRKATEPLEQWQARQDGTSGSAQTSTQQGLS